MIFRKAVSEENLNADGSVLCLCVLPAHQAEDETWQCFPAVLFWSLGWWFCIPSAHPEKEVSLCTCLIIFLTRNVWKKLPYVILGWPEGRMLTSDSRWFSVCSEGHSSIPLLKLGLSAVALQAICWHQMILSWPLSQIRQTDELIQWSLSDTVLH